MIALTLWLGRWQTHRAEEKEARQALLESRSHEPAILLGAASGPAEALLYRRVRAFGQWIAVGQIFIDNQIREGRAGFQVVTPLRLAGSERAVLVNRGWIARTAAYPDPPPVAVPAGEFAVEGIATLPPARVLELAPQTVSGNVWQNLSLTKYGAHTGIEVLPVVILADAPAAGLAAVREKPDTGVARHREYAITWFLLAATLAVLWTVFSFGKPPE